MKRKIKENKGKIKHTSILILLIFGLMQLVCGEEFEEHFDPNSGSSGDYYLGENDSIITIYEYANWYGTWCNYFWFNTFPELKEKYVNTRVVKFIFRDWVWAPETGKMGEAVECAGEQGKYYGYGDYLYHNPTTSTNDLKQYALSLNLNRTQFDNCLDSSKYYAEVWNDKQHSVSGGTPSFAIVCKGSTRIINGPYSSDFSGIDSKINEVLNEQNIIIAEDNMYINSDTTLYNHTYKLKDAGSYGIIIINSSNIVLDCNGSTITGDGSGYGIYVKGFDNVTIKNCIIENYSYGIYLFNSSNNILINNTAGSNGIAGVYLIAKSDLNNILDNKILNNNKGVYFTNAGDCGFFEGNSNNTLTGNEISNNTIGIYSQNSNSTINSNIVCNNTNFDFNSSDWLSSSGNNNNCNNADGWNDAGAIGCTNKCITAVKTYSVSLNYGWNLISIPITPKNTSIKSVLASVEGKYTKVGAWTGGSGKHYIPGFPFNTLTSIDEKMGFWIKMNQPATLTLEGYEPADRKIPLQLGWNLVGYLSTNPNQPLNTALSSISGNYTKVGAWINGTGKHYIPGFPFNTLINMGEGYGYWIKMNSSGVLDYCRS